MSIAGWFDPQGQRPQGNVAIEGAVIKAGSRVSILPESAWRVVESVAQFWARPSSERAADSNRRAWSAIRSHAASAGADMTDFLRKTVVLTPERLRMVMRKGDVGGTSMVELQPSFDGAPDRWLEIFDRIGDVPERYDIPDGNGIVHVMLAPEVRTVLREIRRMPGRRIAGDRAEAFLRNPFATLGPDAAKVIVKSASLAFFTRSKRTSPLPVQLRGSFRTPATCLPTLSAFSFRLVSTRTA